MRTIHVKNLSQNEFYPYGRFGLLPGGDAPKIRVRDRVEFFGDYIVGYMGESATSCSALKIFARDMVIEGMEYHDRCEELLMPLDDDIIVCVAPPCMDGPEPDMITAFCVPQHAMVALRTGVWHTAPYPCKKPCAHVLVGLAERTYATDCVLADLKESVRIAQERAGDNNA